MVTILQTPDATLRKKAALVPETLFNSPELAEILKNMQAGLESQDDAVAIAAPQVGVSYRIFMVGKNVYKEAPDNRVFINPEFVRIGRTKKEVSEGCLSVRWKYGMVKRSTTATVRAHNEKGHEFVASGSGLLAQIFQHEIDHLDGILFIDKAKDIQDMPPENFSEKK